MKKWYIKILLVVLVVGLAELGYTIFNRPELMLKPYLWRVEKIKTSSKVEESLEYIGYVTEIKLSEISENYGKSGKDVEWRELKGKLDLEDEQLGNQIKELLKTIDLEQIDDDRRWLVYLYYRLGLLGAVNDNADMVEYGWGRALRLAPEWSYFYTELANYYLVNGEKVRAFEVLEHCDENSYARAACEEYAESYLGEGSGLLEVGHWEQDVKESYFNNVVQ